MVAVHQRKEEFKPPNPPTGGLKEDILSQFGFIYKKGARFIFYDFLPIVAPFQKKSK